MAARTVRIGFEVGSGDPVEIPLAHTFVTGQTQLSGKTTTLRALVERSGQRALGFITKRGEALEGRSIPPFLPREGEQPIHWRQVETLMASALGQRNLKRERFQILNVARGARSLEQVQANARRLQAEAKRGSDSAQIYELLAEYLDLILPGMRELGAVDTLDLRTGLSVMDLSTVGPQLQAHVIGVTIARINHHESEVLTVLPEAWEFAPRGKSAPAKDEVMHMIRKGAAPGVRNFLLCDSQDIAGVETVVRQGCSVWLLGAQRELNELRRTVQMITAGIKRPKAEDVATLELGQFYVCWGRHAVKTYVQPPWLDDAVAESVARGEVSTSLAIELGKVATVRRAIARGLMTPQQIRDREDTVNEAEARALRDENQQLRTENQELRRRLEALEKGSHGRSAVHDDAAMGSRRASAAREPRADGAGGHTAPVAGDRATPPVGKMDLHDPPTAAVGDTRPRKGDIHPDFSEETENLYQAFKARLIEELPGDARLMQVVLSRPELQVMVKREVVTVDGGSGDGWIGRLIAEGFFDEVKTGYSVFVELQRRGVKLAKPSAYNWCDQMTRRGFLTKEGNQGYRAVPGMKVNIVEAA